MEGSEPKKSLDAAQDAAWKGQEVNLGMADLLRATGSLAEAEFVLDNTVVVVQEVLGNDHATTLKITAIAARLQHAQPGGAVAGKELLAATVARMDKVLGESHAQTGKYRKVLTEME